MRACIYARISPTKKGEKEEDIARSIKTAISICKTRAKQNKDEIVEVYKDQYISGSEQAYMEAFNRMIKDAEQEKFKRIYVRRIDRFGRNISQMIKTEIMLNDKGIGIYSAEEGLDTLTPTGRLVMHIMSNLAEWKRQEILENTERGRREALARGVKFGPPPAEIDMDRVIAQITGTRKSMKDISKGENVSSATVYKRLKQMKKKIVRSGYKRWIEDD